MHIYFYKSIDINDDKDDAPALMTRTYTSTDLDHYLDLRRLSV